MGDGVPGVGRGPYLVEVESGSQKCLKGSWWDIGSIRWVNLHGSILEIFQENSENLKKSKFLKFLT